MSDWRSTIVKFQKRFGNCLESKLQSIENLENLKIEKSILEEKLVEVNKKIKQLCQN